MNYQTQDLEPAYFDRFDVCDAYALLESDYNLGGWLQERPSNQRRREACAVQLRRMGWRGAPGLAFETMTDNGRAIYRNAVARLGLPS